MARRGRRKSILPIGRLFGPPASITLLLSVGYLIYSGNMPGVGDIFGTGSSIESNSIDPHILVNAQTLTARSQDKLRIATFNLQIFGKAKAANQTAMNYIATIIHQFDVLAVQEIKTKSNEPVDQLMALVNSADGKYAIVISDPLKEKENEAAERYAFIWDTTRVQLKPNSNYLVEDDGGLMHREPYVASFSAVTQPSPQYKPFTFTLINVHTDPDVAVQELNVMDDVYLSVKAFEQQDDVIVLGDLNAETSRFGEFGTVPGLTSLNTTENTNTAGTHIIDHIIIDRQQTSEFRNVVGVINFERDFQLTRQQADDISDHRPVYAEFDVNEAVQNTILASRPDSSL